MALLSLPPGTPATETTRMFQGAYQWAKMIEALENGVFVKKVSCPGYLILIYFTLKSTLKSSLFSTVRFLQ
jgi:hypothetical protein